MPEAREEPGEPEVDRIREILFGGHQRAIDERFDALQREVERLQTELDRLRTQAAGDAEALGERLAGLRRDATAQDQILRDALTAAVERIDADAVRRLELSATFATLAKSLRAPSGADSQRAATPRGSNGDPDVA